MPSNRKSKRSSGNRNSKSSKPVAAHHRELTEEETRSFSPPAESRNVEITTERSGGPLSRFVGRIRSMFSRSSSAPAQSGQDREMPIPMTMERTSEPTQPRAARAPRRETDVTPEQLADEYTPTQTSLKGSFRDDGAARQRDQEFTTGAVDERFNDEDHFTNKSNDPRIGTHARTYEAGESRDEPSRS